MPAFAAQWWTNKQSVFSNCEIWELLALTREYSNEPIATIRGSGYVNDELLSLLSHSGRLSWDNQIDIMRVLSISSNAKLVSDFARRLHLKIYGVPGFAILTSPTLGDAIKNIARFSVLLNIKFPVELNPDGLIRLHMSNFYKIDPKFLLLLFRIDLFKINNFIADALNSKSTNRLLYICGVESNLEDFRELLSDLSNYDDLSSITAEIRIPKHEMPMPLPGAISKVHNRCLLEGRELLSNLRANLDVKYAIISRLQNLDIGVPTMADIAADLNMSERTLRRKLMKLDTSFSELRDQVRIALAEQLLVGSTKSTEDVAERLGYSDAANFRHAFKRWHGEPPSFFRKKMINAKLGTATQGNFVNGSILECSEKARREKR